MKRDNQRGAITVYLCIVFLAMVIVAGIIIDAVRIRCAETQVKRVVESSARSVLAGYDKDLKETFGLMVLHENNAKELRDKLKENMEANLNISKPGTSLGDIVSKEKGSLDLYSYKVENVKVAPIYNLTENEITRRQIVEFMKYRAPKEVVENILQKINAVSETGVSAELSGLKMKIDKLYADIVKDSESLNKDITDINSFKYSKIKDYAEKYCVAVRRYRQCLKKTKELRTKISNFGIADTETAKKRLASLKAELKISIQNTKNAEKEKKNCLDSLLKYTDNYINYHQKAFEYITRMQDNTREIRKMIWELRALISKNVKKDSGSFLKDLTDEYLTGGKSNKKYSIAEIEKNLPDDSYLNHLRKDIYSNFGLLCSVQSEINQFEKKYGSSTNGNVNMELKSVLLPKLAGLIDYNNALKAQKMNGITTATKGTDPRKSAEKLAKNSLGSKEKNSKNAIKENQKQLPSYIKKGEYQNKVISPDFTNEDEEYKKRYEAEGESKNSDKGVLTQYSEQQWINKDEIDFGSNDFFNKAFDTVKKIGEQLNDMITNGIYQARDELYVDEYVIGMFTNAVPMLKNGSSVETDLRGNLKKKILKNEVEYILWGNTSENVNLSMVKGQILLIRFVIDTINVYRDPVKVEKAAVIATAASIWSFGLAEPIIQNLILCAWGMADAVNDLNKVMEGHFVPAFKKYSGVEDKNDGFSYHDYLRIFLLLEPQEKKMDRIEDLIELKSEKKIAGYNSCLRIEAYVSIKYMFLSKAFIPKKLRTEDGSRHLIKVVLYKGY